MVVIGITGGIGSGKTTVAGEWEKLGAFVMYADEAAKNLMTSNANVKEAISKTFGDEAYHPDGSLNRPLLSREALEKNRVKELNAIVHPAVYEETKRLIKQERERGTKAFVKEAALLLQNGRPEGFDVIVLCEADEKSRVKRVIQRDKTDAGKVKERIQKQQDFSSLRPLADYIIENNGTLDELKKKARKLFGEIVGGMESE